MKALSLDDWKLYLKTDDFSFKERVSARGLSCIKSRVYMSYSHDEVIEKLVDFAFRSEFDN